MKIEVTQNEFVEFNNFIVMLKNNINEESFKFDEDFEMDNIELYKYFEKNINKIFEKIQSLNN